MVVKTNHNVRFGLPRSFKVKVDVSESRKSRGMHVCCVLLCAVVCCAFQEYQGSTVGSSLQCANQTTLLTPND